MSKNDIPVSAGDDSRRGTRKLGILLIDDFSLISYASVLEPFRAANRLSGTTLYSWRHYSANGDVARASNGLAIHVDGPLIEAHGDDLVFVCAGGNPAHFDDKATFAQLRRLAKHGAIIGGISGGPFILARAGLLDGYRCTIHWEHEAAFSEAFPHLALERDLYVIDRSRVTCAGGAGGLDLAIDLIMRDHGPKLAEIVGDWYIRSEPRAGGVAQRRSVPQRYGIAHKGLARAIEAMESNLAEPLTRGALAHLAGLSVRQLERLFAGKLNTTIGAHYQQLRLEAARRLLCETDLSRSETALACGFVSPSHFSRAFSRHFGMTPGDIRRLIEAGRAVPRGRSAESEH